MGRPSQARNASSCLACHRRALVHRDCCRPARRCSCRRLGLSRQERLRLRLCLCRRLPRPSNHCQRRARRCHRSRPDRWHRRGFGRWCPHRTRPTQPKRHRAVLASRRRRTGLRSSHGPAAPTQRTGSPRHEASDTGRTCALGWALPLRRSSAGTQGRSGIWGPRHLMRHRNRIAPSNPSLPLRNRTPWSSRTCRRRPKACIHSLRVVREPWSCECRRREPPPTCLLPPLDWSRRAEVPVGTGQPGRPPARARARA